MYPFYAPASTCQSSTSNQPHQALSSVKISAQLWHQRLGHPHAIILNKLLNSCNLPMAKSIVPRTIVDCTSCSLGKMHKLPFDLSNTQVNAPFDLVHIDVWGPSPFPHVPIISFTFLLLMISLDFVGCIHSPQRA